MIVDRRTFILVSTPFAAAAASLAIFPSLVPGPETIQLATGKTEPDGVVFKISGWDRFEGIASNVSKTLPADSVTNDPKGDQVWISINQSWKTAWR